MSTHTEPQNPPQSIADAIHHNPILAAIQEDTDPVEVPCNGLPVTDEYDRITGRETCSAVVTIAGGLAKMASASLCCDECCQRYDYRRRVDECRETWERWMRDNAERFAHFSTDHPEFNKQAWAELKSQPVSKNVILFGPTGTGKTFLMLQRMKAAMWHGKGPIVVLWADQLKKMTRDRYNSREVDAYANAGVLGIEELFGEDSAREAYTSFVRNLIDVRLRLRKPTIITTQLQSKDLEGEFDKYDNETRADSERRHAILRRIHEEYYPINTDRNRDYSQDSIF